MLKGSQNCYKCGQMSHFHQECLMWGKKVQSSSRGRGSNHLYTMDICQDQENSLDVVTCTLGVFSFNLYDLPYSSVTLCFVTQHVADKFEILLEYLLEPFSMCTPTGESILDDRVYRDCMCLSLVEIPWLT